MPNLTIKNVPTALYRRLKRSAAEHRRSLNSEVIVTLEQAHVAPRPNPAKILASMRILRERVSRGFLTDDELRAAKNEGRL